MFPPFAARLARYFNFRRDHQKILFELRDYEWVDEKSDKTTKKLGYEN